MTNDILHRWLGKHFVTYFPSVCDLPGHRVWLKLDTGPGRQTSEFLSWARVEGIDIAPGLPNSTEMGQEMDQLFGPFKNSIYWNRKLLLDVKGKLEKNDIGHIIFGGEIVVNGKERIYLEKSFERFLSADHIKKARVKCGYCPATRNALFSKKLRSELVENEQGDIVDDEAADPYTQTLVDIEKLNHDTVEELVKKGYTHALEAKRNAMRVSMLNGKFGGATTEPHTEERRALLEKVRYAGDFFHVTGGGGVVNSADMLLAMERKEMQKQAEEIEKKKALIEKFADIKQKATNIFNQPYSSWKKPDYLIAIKYKLGPAKAFGRGNGVVGNKKVDELKEWYERDFKGKPKEWDDDEWESVDSIKLDDLKSGKVSSLQESGIYGKALETQTNFFVSKFLTMSFDRHKEVSKQIYQRMSEDKRKFDDSRRELLLQNLLNNNNTSATSINNNKNCARSDENNTDIDRGDENKNNENNYCNDGDDNKNMKNGDDSFLTSDNLSLKTPSFCCDEVNVSSSPNQESSTNSATPDIIIIEQAVENSQNNDRQNKSLKKSSNKIEKGLWPFFSATENNKEIGIYDDSAKKTTKSPIAPISKDDNYWNKIIIGNNLSENILLRKVNKIKEAKISHLSTLSKSDLWFFVLARMEKEHHDTIPTKKGTFKNVKDEKECLLKIAFDVRGNDLVFEKKND